MRKGKVFFLISTLVILGIACGDAVAQEDAIERGLIAVKQKEWELALKHFQEAQTKAPLDPIIIFNLALASDKSGGRDLFSMAYYRAYLILAPEAENAKQVSSRIKELEVKIEVEARNLIKKAKEGLAQVDQKENGIPYAGIIKALVDTGDITAALNLAVAAPLDANSKMFDFSDIARAQVISGDVNAARQTVAKLSATVADDYDRKSATEHVLGTIAYEQAKQGDFSGAKQTAQSISDQTRRNLTYRSIMEFQLKAKDFAAAEQTANLITGKDDYLADAYSLVARAKAEAGDLLGARKYIGLAKDKIAKAVSPLPDIPAIGEDTITHLAMAEAAVGDIDAARKTTQTLDKKSYAINSYTMDINKAIAMTMMRSGKIDEAKNILSGLSDYYFRAKAYREIVEAQIKKGDMQGAQNTAAIIEPKDIKYSAYSEFERAQGRLKEAGVYAIYAIMNDPAFKEMEDLPGFIQSLKSKETKWIPWYIANTATNLTIFSKQLREVQEKDKKK